MFAKEGFRNAEALFPPQSFRPLSITNGGITSTSVYNAQNLSPRRALFPIPVCCGALPRIGDADEEDPDDEDELGRGNWRKSADTNALQNC